MTLSESDRCPVCAMFPARRPQTAAAMTLKSGETFYFCGNGCLLRTWLRPSVYLGRSQAEIDRLVGICQQNQPGSITASMASVSPPTSTT